MVHSLPTAISKPAFPMRIGSYVIDDVVLGRGHYAIVRLATHEPTMEKVFSVALITIFRNEKYGKIIGEVCNIINVVPYQTLMRGYGLINYFETNIFVLACLIIT